MQLRGWLFGVAVLGTMLAGCRARKSADTTPSWAVHPEPGEVELFAPGTISTGEFEMNATFTPDGREMYFTRASVEWDTMTIYMSHWEKGGWSTPEVAPFSGEFVDSDPYVSPTGRRLFFASKRGADGQAKSDFDIWYVRREQDGWSMPVHVAGPVNSESHDVHPTITLDGVLWFSSDRSGGQGEWDSWYALPGDSGEFVDVQNPGPPVNGLGSEVDACISPGGRLLVFSSHDQPVHYGSGDLYFCVLDDSAWSDPENFDPPVNSKAMECCPSLTPDSRYLYFTSTRMHEGMMQTTPSTQGTFEFTVQEGPGNGLGDIYAVELIQLGPVQEAGWSPPRRTGR